MKRALIPLVAILSACDPAPPPQPEVEHPPNPVFETQIKAMDQARAVEAQVMEAAKAQRRQIDEAAQQ